jgi:hypothetical protein
MFKLDRSHIVRHLSISPLNAIPRHTDHARLFDELTRANRRLRALFDARGKGAGLTLSRARR